MKRWLALALLGACGASDAASPDGGDAASQPDAPPGCSRPALDAPWLGGLLATTVTELTEMPRATTMQRDRARSYLRTVLEQQGWAATFQTYPGGANVVAEIPATMGDGKRLVVGAHFDTVAGSPGASDNATGVAVVVALGRYLQDTPCRTAPITLALFDQEELGFFGSRALARAVRPADIAAVHTIDQVGWDADGDRRFELELPTPALEAEWQAAAAVLGVPLTTTATGGTDHEAFRDEGHAAVGLTEEYVGGDTSPHRHAASDVASTIDAGYHALAAQLAAQVVLEAVAP